MEKRTFKHKSTGWIAKTWSDSTCSISDENNIWQGEIKSVLIENSCDWEEVVEKSYELIKHVDVKGNVWQGSNCIASCLGDGKEHILSVKRLSDGEVFSVGDTINFNEKGTGKLLEIQFEVAPVDKGTVKLCFENDHPILGRWWTIDQLKKVKTPIYKNYTTEDNLPITEDQTFYIYDNKNFKCMEAKFGQFLSSKWDGKRYKTKKEVEKLITLEKPKYCIKHITSVLNSISIRKFSEDEVLEVFNYKQD